VPTAPEAAGVRVWEIMSRGRERRGGRPPPVGANVGYPLLSVNSVDFSKKESEITVVALKPTKEVITKPLR
jgi:hypothetical protein